jgi:hypothetical protein
MHVILNIKPNNIQIVKRENHATLIYRYFLWDKKGVIWYKHGPFYIGKGRYNMCNWQPTLELAVGPMTKYLQLL